VARCGWSIHFRFWRISGNPIQVIESQQQLARLLAELRHAPSVAVDTEADSLHAYPEKLCLIQLSIPGTDALVDPLAEQDLSVLLEVLQGRDLIFHGADYDLRLLYRTFHFVPRRLIDTMWAARLLGYREFSLSGLVQQHLGVALEKGPQKMNWALRPLSKRMITYASNDTRYLHSLSKILVDRLRELGRVAWLEEVCARMVRDCATRRTQDPDAVWRVKGSDRLDRAGMAMLRELWNWREKEAIAANKPPYFVLSHERLVALAASAARLSSCDNLLPNHFSSKRTATLRSAMERGLKVPTGEYPVARRSSGVRLTREQQERFAQLKEVRDRRAAELGLDPTVIGSKADLISVARHRDPAKADLMEWQKHLLALG
jgi:ribonuclease D